MRHQGPDPARHQRPTPVPYRRIAALAAPIALANAFALSAQWLIVVIIGRFGEEALYLRSLYLPLAFVFAAVQVGIEVSTLVAVARHRGEHDGRAGRLSTVVRPMAGLGGAVMATTALLVGAGAGLIGAGLGVDGGAAGAFSTLLRLMGLAALAEVPSMVLTATLRGWGRTGAASAVSVAVMMTQIAGVAVLGGPGGLGVRALPAAIALSGVVGAGLSAVLLHQAGLLSGAVRSTAVSADERPVRAAAAVLRSVGAPVAGTFLLLFLANGAFLRILDPFGRAVVAGFGIASTTQTVVIVPALGLGTAVAILANQGRAGATGVVRRGAVLAVALYLPLGVGLAALAGVIARLTTPDPAVATVVTDYLRVVGPTVAGVGIMLSLLTVLEQTGSGVVALTFNVVYFGLTAAVGAAAAAGPGQYRALFTVMTVANLVALAAIVPVTIHRMRRFGAAAIV